MLRLRLLTRPESPDRCLGSQRRHSRQGRARLLRRPRALEDMQLRGLEVELVEQVALVLRNVGLLLVGRQVGNTRLEVSHNLLLVVSQWRND